MSKFITEQSLRNIQLNTQVSERHERRRMCIHLACQISMIYGAYQAAMSSSNALKTNLTYEDYESIAPLLKNVFHIDVSPTDFFSEPDKDADRAIAEWKYYRKVLDVFGGALIKTEVVEELCKQLYEEYSVIPFVGIIHHYMGEIALSIFRYMREYIDYQTLCEEIDKIYVIKGKKLDRRLLSIIEPYGEEWAHRYIKLLKEMSK